VRDGQRTLSRVVCLLSLNCPHGLVERHALTIYRVAQDGLINLCDMRRKHTWIIDCNPKRPPTDRIVEPSRTDGVSHGFATDGFRGQGTAGRGWLSEWSILGVFNGGNAMRRAGGGLTAPKSPWRGEHDSGFCSGRFHAVVRRVIPLAAAVAPDISVARRGAYGGPPVNVYRCTPMSWGWWVRTSACLGMGGTEAVRPHSREPAIRRRRVIELSAHDDPSHYCASGHE